MAAVTGLVLPAELDTEAQVLFERYRSFGRGFVPRRVARENGGPVAHRYGAAGDYGTGANMAFRRAVFERIGPFDPRSTWARRLGAAATWRCSSGC